MGNISQTPSIPAPLALYDGEIVTTSVAVGASNTAYLVGVVLYVQSTLTNIRCRFGTGGAGHYDVGIYDASGSNNQPGNLLAHAASSNTALATATGVQTPALIGGNLSLPPGRYWLALWVDNATDTINRQSGNSGLVVCMSGTTTGPLPSSAASLTGLGNQSFKPILIGLLQNSWS
jgi:hypothetical protein